LEQRYVQHGEPLKGPYLLDMATYREIGNIQLAMDKRKQGSKKRRKNKKKSLRKK
jgi:hypothetical protein